MFNPRAKILGVVISFVISGISAFVTATSAGLLEAQSIVFGAVRSAGSAVDSSFASVGDSLLAVESDLFGILVSVGAGAGVAAPIAQAVATLIAVALVAALVFATYWVAKVIIGLIVPP
ncbi:hypothetical protein DV707_07575 [Halobellus limi]|uniref:Uncharacterized protein n=1 Tax=Halobellus limi TaxID=699433 RepID=A0A4D6H3G9_9EURY|nr:hypothetical protein DV707_07575 [Halobellus limi]